MYEVEILNPADHREEIRTFLNEGFGDQNTADQFLWKFEHNPAGIAKILAVLDPKTSRIIGTQVVSPRIFLHAGNEVRVSQLSDGAVHSDYRGKGIFRTLLNASLELMKKEDSAFGLTYANEHSAPALRKLQGAHELFSLREFFRPLGGVNIVQNLLPNSPNAQRLLAPLIGGAVRASAIRGKAAFELEPVSDFDQVFEEWSREFASLHLYFPHRSVPFLEWKAKNVPQMSGGSLSAYWFLRKGNRIGYCVLYYDSNRSLLKIIDCLVTNAADYLTPALRTLLVYAMRNNYDAVKMNAAGAVYQQSLRRAGYWAGKRLRCNLIGGSHKIPQSSINESLWALTPIDRDNFTY